MNFEFLMKATDGKIFKIMADVIEKLLSKRMDIVVQQSRHIPNAPANWRKPQLTSQSCFHILFPSKGTWKAYGQAYGPLQILSKHRFRCNGCTSFWEGRSAPTHRVEP